MRVGLVAVAAVVGCGQLASPQQTARDAGGGADAASAPETSSDSAARIPRESGADAGGCPGGAVPCRGACVDVQSDPLNCGGCGLVCETTCSGGECPVTLAAASNPYAMAIDSKNVYWTQESEVMEVPVGGGPSTQLATEDETTQYVAVGGGEVYWTDSYDYYEPYEDVGEPLFHLYRVPTTGGARHGSRMGGTCEGLAVLAGRVYWSSGGEVLSLPLGAGGTPMTFYLGEGVQSGPVTNAGSVSWLLESYPDTSSNNEKILTQPLEAGAPLALSSRFVNANAIAVNSTNVFVIDYSSLYSPDPTYTLVRVPLSGGSATTLASGPAAERVVADDTNVYWTTTIGVLRMPVAGGATTTISNDYATAIVLDATSVYWATHESIVKMTPK